MANKERTKCEVTAALPDHTAQDPRVQLIDVEEDRIHGD
jgi:hypothetical protein